jgi:hypothetical protein
MLNPCILAENVALPSARPKEEADDMRCPHCEGPMEGDFPLCGRCESLLKVEARLEREKKESSPREGGK